MSWKDQMSSHPTICYFMLHRVVLRLAVSEQRVTMLQWFAFFLSWSTLHHHHEFNHCHGTNDVIIIIIDHLGSCQRDFSVELKNRRRRRKNWNRGWRRMQEVWLWVHELLHIEWMNCCILSRWIIGLRVFLWWN